MQDYILGAYIDLFAAIAEQARIEGEWTKFIWTWIQRPPMPAIWKMLPDSALRLRIFDLVREEILAVGRLRKEYKSGEPMPITTIFESEYAQKIQAIADTRKVSRSRQLHDMAVDWLKAKSEDESGVPG